MVIIQGKVKWLVQQHMYTFSVGLLPDSYQGPPDLKSSNLTTELDLYNKFSSYNRKQGDMLELKKENKEKKNYRNNLKSVSTALLLEILSRKRLIYSFLGST